MQKTQRTLLWRTKKNFTYAGIHMIADFWNGIRIEDRKKLKHLLLRAAKVAESTPLEVTIHSFSPFGMTGVVLLAESHIAIHTWPEIGYIAVDIFTCGAKSRPERALEFLQKTLKPKEISVKKMKRGVLKKK